MAYSRLSCIPSQAPTAWAAMSHYVDEKARLRPQAVACQSARWQRCREDAVWIRLAHPAFCPIVKLCGGFWHWGDHLRANGPTSAHLIVGACTCEWLMGVPPRRGARRRGEWACGGGGPPGYEVAIARPCGCNIGVPAFEDPSASQTGSSSLAAARR